jgi:ParB family chromosome partitioning protein
MRLAEHWDKLPTVGNLRDALRLLAADAPEEGDASPPPDEPSARKPLITLASGEFEWYTPPNIVEAARAALGGIDLDPASCDEAQTVVRAATYFTKNTDGLSRPWFGRVWLNPPYAARLIDQFVGKLIGHVEAGEVTSAVLLVNNATETNWCQRCLAAASASCLIAGRIPFWGPNGGESPPRGSLAFYFGGDVPAFLAAFQDLGTCNVPLPTAPPVAEWAASPLLVEDRSNDELPPNESPTPDPGDEDDSTEAEEVDAARVVTSTPLTVPQAPRVPALPADVIVGSRPWSVVQANVLDFLGSLPADSVDLVFGSPPYEDARTYGIDFSLSGQDWVDWMIEVYRASLRVCTGLVAFVVEGRTEGFRWSATPALLLADLHRAGINLYKPPIYHRIGIPGSGGRRSDHEAAGGGANWLRNDYEFVVAATRGGKLPWADGTAMGHRPKYAPGGDPSHRRQDGSRVNRGPWGETNDGDTPVPDGRRTPLGFVGG